MVAFLDNCRFSPTAGGTTDWTYSSAVTGYQSPSAAGVVNGALYRYTAISSDGTQWEIGYGTYNTTTGVLTRGTVLFNSAGTTAKINFTVAPTVAIVLLAEDLLSIFGGAGAIRGYLAGCQLSNDGTAPNTKINVSAGMWSDDGNAVMFNAASGSIDCTTTGANGLDTGALAAGTWYHAFATGTVGGGAAYLASTSLTPTLPSGYTYKRRLGSFKTDGSSHIIAFTQEDDEFLWSTPVLDISVTNLGTTATLYTLSAPTGVQVRAVLGVAVFNSGGQSWVNVSSPDQADVAPAVNGVGNVYSAGTNTDGGTGVVVRTNTSAQIRARAVIASTNVYATTYGWFDRRGRDA